MRFPSKETVERIRREYPVGSRVELVRMDDPQAPPIGTKGTVRGVDDIGSIMVAWDKVKYKGIRTGKRRTVNAFVYIMHEERPIGVPSDFYMRTCLEGYDTFYFDPSILLAAYDKSLEVCGYERD